MITAEPSGRQDPLAFYLDTSDAPSWKAVGGLSLATQNAARAAGLDEQYSAVQWLAITMNVTNRISILSHHPVRRPADAPGL